MTAAERRAALIVEAGESPSLTDRVLLAVLVEVQELRADLARREGRRMEVGGVTFQQGAPKGQQALPGSGPTTFPNYGRNKQGPIVGASAGDLDYYANGARRSLADSSKAKYHDRERALLAAIDAEIARQAGGTEAASGSDSDVDVPF